MEENLSFRKENDGDDDQFQKRLRLEIGGDVPRDDRLESVASLIPLVKTCSLVSLEVLWEVMDDMAVYEADLDYRRAAFQLLQASAINLKLPSHRTKVFNMMITPVNHSLAKDQLMAVSQLGSMGLQSKVASFLVQSIKNLFPVAEEARQSHHRLEDLEIGSSKAIHRQRPDEEVALLKCLSLSSHLLTDEPNSFIGDDLGGLISIILDGARSTTGAALMRGFMSNISAAAKHVVIPQQHLLACLQLLCKSLYNDRYRFSKEAEDTIIAVFDSDLCSRSLPILLEDIMAAPDQPDNLRSSIFNLLLASSANLTQIPCIMTVFQQSLKNACDKMHSASVRVAPLVGSLFAIMSTYGRDLDNEAFDSVVVLVHDSMNQSQDENSMAFFLELADVQRAITLFLDCLLTSNHKVLKLYTLLLRLAQPPLPALTRLAVYKLLARVRCDSDYGIKIVSIPDQHDLASSLCRTQATAKAARIPASPSSHASSSGQSQPTRSNRSRTSDVHASGRRGRSRSRSGTRSYEVKDRFPPVVEPLWVYDECRRGLPSAHPSIASTVVYARKAKQIDSAHDVLSIGQWLEIMIRELSEDNEAPDWELYSYVLVHLPSQLSNCSLFEECVTQISELHELLNSQLSGNTFPEPPEKSGNKRGDVALCLYHALSMLLAYENYIGVRQWNRTVSTMRIGIEKWDRCSKYCLHALALCCHEIPHIMVNHVTVIIEMMGKRITSSDLSMDILEFLSGLARTPDAYDTTDVSLHQKIFGICIRYLQHARQQKRDLESASRQAAEELPNRGSGSSLDAFRYMKIAHLDRSHRNTAEYVFTIAYQVIIYWFLAIDVRLRNKHVPWITQELIFTAEDGRQVMDQQSLVLVDLLHRTAFSDLGETRSAPQFDISEGEVYSKSWLVGMSVITARAIMDMTSEVVICGEFTKRQASGTTHAVYYHNTVDLPAHHMYLRRTTSHESRQERCNLYLNHMMLQLVSTISPEPAPLQPIPLPENDDFTTRALKLFDATDTVDGHKAAVIYRAEGQTLEDEILANPNGSDSYDSFLDRLGTCVQLKGATFNTQGLDRHTGSDGSHTVAWRDRVSEIVFHVPTMMPNDLVNDPKCNKKRSHIGNDHVKIIFDESGLPFRYDTFASDFNSVNIVITPEAHTHGTGMQRDRTSHSREVQEPTVEGADQHDPSATDRFGYFTVQAFNAAIFPEFSIASPRIVSAGALPGFVRQVAIASSVLCQIWDVQGTSVYTSSWRFRLQQILKLRQKYAESNVSANVDYPKANGTGPALYLEGVEWAGSMAYGGMTEKGKLTASMDFTRWTM